MLIKLSGTLTVHFHHSLAATKATCQKPLMVSFWIMGRTSRHKLIIFIMLHFRPFQLSEK